MSNAYAEWDPSSDTEIDTPIVENTRDFIFSGVLHDWGCLSPYMDNLLHTDPLEHWLIVIVAISTYDTQVYVLFYNTFATKFVFHLYPQCSDTWATDLAP
jgi:hypothetical protein